MKLTLDILELQMKSKKKSVLKGVSNGRHVVGGNSLFNFFKGAIKKKKETLIYNISLKNMFLYLLLRCLRKIKELLVL